jgi:hypothetical protein
MKQLKLTIYKIQHTLKILKRESKYCLLRMEQNKIMVRVESGTDNCFFCIRSQKWQFHELI